MITINNFFREINNGLATFDIFPPDEYEPIPENPQEISEKAWKMVGDSLWSTLRKYGVVEYE